MHENISTFVEQPQPTEQDIYNDRLSEIVAQSFTPPWKLAAEASHGTWSNIVKVLGEEKPDADRSFAEISPHNAGNNVANVYVVAEYVNFALMDQETGPAMVETAKAWSADARPIAEKFKSKEFATIRNLVLQAAEYIHNGYAYSKQKFNDVWRRTAAENRFKSIVGALSIVDNILRQLSSEQPIEPTAITNENNNIQELQLANYPIEAERTHLHDIWDQMMTEVTYMYDPEAEQSSAAAVETERRRIRAKFKELIGDALPDHEIEEKVTTELKEIFSPKVIDAYQTVAQLVQQGWSAVQLTNPLRIAIPYESDKEAGKRKSVMGKDLSPTQRGLVLGNFSGDLDRMLEAFRKANKLESIDAARREIASRETKDVEQVNADDVLNHLKVDTDPRIGTYSALTEVDKGNNIVAIASTYESLRRNLLGMCENPQAVVSVLENIVRHGLVNPRGAFDGSMPIIEQLAAEQHAAWAANAFVRDGISAERATQAVLYRDLPHLGQPGVSEDWQDEKQYDRLAVIRSCAVLLVTFMHKCDSHGYPVKIGDDVAKVLKDLKLKSVGIDLMFDKT